MFYDLFGKDYSYIDEYEIVVEKYTRLNINTLKGFCNKYKIEFSYGETRDQLACVTIPSYLENRKFLSKFYQSLSKEQKEIFQYIVYYNGPNLAKQIKEHFNFDIIDRKKTRKLTPYVWWLDLFLYDDKIDDQIKLNFQDVITDKGISKPLKQKRLILQPTFKELQGITLDRYNLEGEKVDLRLHKIPSLDFKENIHILYELIKDEKVSVTQKGDLAKRSINILDTKMTYNGSEYRRLINILIKINYIDSQKTIKPFKAFDNLISKESGSIAKDIFKKFIDQDIQDEFTYLNFHTRYTNGNFIKNFRNSLVEIIQKLNSDHWISIEYIVNEIKIDKNTLKSITNGHRDVYGFYKQNKIGYYNTADYNKMEHLQTIVRYFIKTFIGLSHTLGLVELAVSDSFGVVESDIEYIYDHNIATFGNVEFFRLTELGKYGYGLVKSFKQISNTKITLNPTLLKIDVENISNKPISNSVEIFLSKFSIKESDTRYRTDLKIFMENLKNKKDYEDIKNGLLSKVIKVPQNWKDFFKLMESRFEAAKIKSDEVVLIEISKQEDIIQILQLDKKLQQKIIKAENYQIVVFKKDLTAVKKIFKTYGVFL